jgi:hypothetical protein
MTKTYAAAVLAAVLVVRWLVTAQMTVTVAGFPVIVPVLAVALGTVLAAAGTVVVLVVHQDRAQREIAEAWRARRAAAR